MLSNYIKLAWMVLGRKKFFTFISLFGISFTLMILMALTAYFDSEMGAHKPLSQADRLLLMDRIVLKLIVPDTVRTVDSTLAGGVMRYDTTVSISGENVVNYNSSSFSYFFLDQYLRDLPYTGLATFYSAGHSFDLFVNSKKLSLAAIYTDGNYWQVFDFQFIEGRPYQALEVENRAPVLILSRQARDSYFGQGQSAVGKEIVLNDQVYQVIGVVEDVNASKFFVHADVYLPMMHLRPGVLQSQDYTGPFGAALLATSSADRPRLEAEIGHLAGEVPILRPDEHNHIFLTPYTLQEQFASQIFFEENKQDTMRWFYGVIGGLVALFTLLPTLNLINVNITRILERSSEIGVRKAFGASTRDLLLQFVFENVILTLIGGAIGLVLAWWLVYLLNTTQMLGEQVLSFQPTVFVYALLITLAFGVVSGILPAWRMSRLHVTEALKQHAA